MSAGAFQNRIIFSIANSRLIEQGVQKESFPTIVSQILSRSNLGSHVRRSSNDCLKNLPGRPGGIGVLFGASGPGGVGVGARGGVASADGQRWDELQRLALCG